MERCEKSPEREQKQVAGRKCEGGREEIVRGMRPEEGRGAGRGRGRKRRKKRLGSSSISRNRIIPCKDHIMNKYRAG